MSGFANWKQQEHVGEWVLLEENMGERLSIDETKLHHDLFTFLSNKDGHCKKGTLIAAVKGTTVAEVTKQLDQIPKASRKKVKEVIEIEPKMKVAYGLLCALRNIFSKCKTRKRAKKALHKWYKSVGNTRIREIISVRDTIKSKEEYILNYFKNRSTNAFAESLNSKIKGLRAQVHGVSDMPFFMFRCTKIFG